MARVILGSSVGAIVALSTARAHADASPPATPPCATVQAEGELPAAWANAVGELRAQIGRLRPSECQPMVLTLVVSPDGAAARMAAMTSDGRHAERDVARPEALVAIGLGLLMGASPSETPTSAAPAAVSQSATPTAGESPTRAPTSTPSPNLSLWISLDGGGRANGPTAVATLDLRASVGLLLDRWLLALALGGAPTGVTSEQGLDVDAYREVNAALEVGRRVSLGRSALDVAADLSIVGMRMEYDFADGRETAGSDVELGLGALARLCLPLGPRWDLTLALEGRLLPGNAISASLLEIPPGEPAEPGVPPTFPAWSGALRIGARGELFR